MKLIDAKLNEAFNSLDDQRDQRLLDAYEFVESNMVLIGCTAVEGELIEKLSTTFIFFTFV